MLSEQTQEATEYALNSLQGVNSANELVRKIDARSTDTKSITETMRSIAVDISNKVNEGYIKFVKVTHAEEIPETKLAVQLPSNVQLQLIKLEVKRLFRGNKEQLFRIAVN